MDDDKIVQLYLARDEQAIRETSAKYGAYCHKIAMNLLGSEEDAEECMNDTWLRAWNAIPPAEPASLAAFLGKITRNLAIDRYKESQRQKRGGGETPAVLDELEEMIPAGDSPEDLMLQTELAEEIDAFLLSLPKEKRYMFIRRCWYLDDIKDIAADYRMTKNHAAVILSRLRKKLKAHLKKKGYGS